MSSILQIIIYLFIVAKLLNNHWTAKKCFLLFSFFFFLGGEGKKWMIVLY